MKNNLRFHLFFLFIVTCLLVNAKQETTKKAKKAVNIKVKEIKREKTLKKEDIKKLSTRQRSYENPLEDKLIKQIAETLDYLKKTIKELPKNSQSRAQVMEKVLDLSLEQASYVANKENRQFENEWDNWQENDKKGKEPKLDSSKSKKYFESVAKYANRLLKDFPKYKNAVSVYYQKAIALQFLGYEKEAARSFYSIVKKYPKSSTAGDAFFSLGDYYFNTSNFSKSKMYFNNAIKFKSSKRYGWALFKLAWCYYNLGDYKKALSFWKKTVIFSEVQGKDQNILKNEALRDMTFAYAELKNIDDAIKFFRVHGNGSHIARMLFFLGQTYNEQGKFKSALVIYNQLIKLEPKSKEAFKAQTEIAVMFFEKFIYDNLWKQLKIIAQNYNAKSNWAEDKDTDFITDSEKKIREITLYYPKKIHQIAQKNKKDILFKQALTGYNLFLDLYPDDPVSTEIYEYVGDILYTLKNYKEASDYYIKIVKLGKDKAVTYDENSKIKENIHKRSADNMLDAIGKYFNPEFERLKKIKPVFNQTVDNEKKNITLSKQANRFLEGCKLYLSFYPEDKKIERNCDIFTSEIFYRNADTDKAREYLYKVAIKYAGSKEGFAAADNLIPLYSKDKKKQLEISFKLLSIEKYAKSALGKKLLDLIRAYNLEDIASVEEPSKKAKLYEDFANKNPNDKEIDKLLFNASSNYLLAKDILNSIRTSEILIKKYPKFKERSNLIIQNAQLYDKVFDFNQAITNYMIFIKSYPKDKRVPGAFQRVCEIKILEKSSDMLSFCTAFANAYKVVGKFLFRRIIDAAIFEGDRSHLYNTITNIYLKKFKISSNETVTLYYQIYKIYGPNSSEGKNAYLKIKSIGKRNKISGEALRYVAQIDFEEKISFLEKHNKIALVGGKVDNLQKSIQNISTSISNLEQIFSKVVQRGDAYTGAKSYLVLAMSYLDFANKLSNPPQIEGVETSAVKEQLKGSADELYAKAVEYLKLGYDICMKYKVIDSVSLDLYNQLAIHLKDRPLLQQWIINTDIVSIDVNSDFFERLND